MRQFDTTEERLDYIEFRRPRPTTHHPTQPTPNRVN